MIHSMGGSIRKEMGGKVTHLIANCCGGEKYKYAVTFRVPIMSMNWVIALWETKHDPASYGNNEELVSYLSVVILCRFFFFSRRGEHCKVLEKIRNSLDEKVV